MPEKSESAPAQREGWPAKSRTIERARKFLAGCAGQRVVVACDSDVDGLSSAVIVERALDALGADRDVVPLRRGETVHTEAMKERIRELRPARLIVLDTGSRPEPLSYDVPTLMIDHHDASKGLPPDALVVNGFDASPVAPTSVLAFVVCAETRGIRESAWLGGLGAVADLGSAAPFVELLGTKVPVTAARKAAALLNAARRAPNPDPTVALDTLRRATGVPDIVSGRLPGARRLDEMQAQVRAEMERCSRVAPKIAGDVALIRFATGAQVHPVVAIRWAGRLRPKIVVAANDGYLPGRTNFAVRSADGVDVLSWLRTRPFTPEDPAEYGNGHPRATGGSLTTADFNRFAAALGFVVT